jgi:cold shock CspA family protein
MQIDGTLKKWNKDRGFGFIAPRRGGDDIFVHITSLPRDGKQPQIGELLTFEVKKDKNGRKQAVNVCRPGSRNTSISRRMPAKSSRHSLIAGSLLTMGVLVAIFGYAFSNRSTMSVADQTNSLSSQRELTTDTAVTSDISTFRCDGRTHCSQMTSCDEAKYFLANCPGVKMDGNSDGVPCEKQWCGY